MKFVFIAKHRTIWPVAWLCECAGRLPVGLPCLAEPIAERQIPKRRSGRPTGQGELPCQRPDLRRTARLATTCWPRASTAACTGSSG